ncbi:sporulation protein [Photobacterium damselae]|uniref:sporulation protein n=1 Tax=Photobacterium damselae TaxID=38293 RepID=UPI0040697C83
MFTKLKASLGIGGAKVDTIVDNSVLYQGETLHGTIHIHGGEVTQQVDAIHLKLNTEVQVETEQNSHYEVLTLGSLQLTDSFEIEAHQQLEIPFTLALHDETPITALNASHNQSHVWIETTLDLNFAIDPQDRDYLEIKPLPVVEKILQTIENRGYTLAKADVEKGQLRGNGFLSQSGCYQEIEFRNDSMFSDKELELSFVLEGSLVHCLVEVDAGRGDHYFSFSLPLMATDNEIEGVLAGVV